MIPPEGDLSKAASFDGALGIFLLTLAVFVGLAPFTERGQRVWTSTVVALSLISYAMENIQIARGIDPRFSHVGSIADQLGGAFFLLIATGLLVTFAILFAKVLLSGASRNSAPLMLAIRYGCGATAFGFATGYLMSAVVGSRFGVAGNILPLHAMGFHSLQASLWSHSSSFGRTSNRQCLDVGFIWQAWRGSEPAWLSRGKCLPAGRPWNRLRQPSRLLACCWCGSWRSREGFGRGARRRAGKLLRFLRHRPCWPKAGERF